jgi:hypothetical protein
VYCKECVGKGKRFHYRSDLWRISDKSLRYGGARVFQFTLKWINTEFFIFILAIIRLSEKINKGLCNLVRVLIDL